MVAIDNLGQVIRIVDEGELRALLREPEALASARLAFRALAEERIVQPAPIGMTIPGVDGEIHIKGAYLVGSPIYAFKVATGFPNNGASNLPPGSGLFVVFDARTGFPLALFFDNGYLTDLRTGAAGALAIDLLTPKFINKVAVLGTGVQARYQLRAAARVRRWSITHAWGRSSTKVNKYCKEMERELGIPFMQAGSPEDAVRDADLLVTTTASRTPLVREEWLKSNATVVAMGSDAPDKQELSSGVLARADRIVVDHRGQCAALGELHHALEKRIFGEEKAIVELGQILTGREPARNPSELIVCDLTGVGAQDAAIAEAAWNFISRDNPHSFRRGIPEGRNQR